MRNFKITFLTVRIFGVCSVAKCGKSILLPDLMMISMKK